MVSTLTTDLHHARQSARLASTESRAARRLALGTLAVRCCCVYWYTGGFGSDQGAVGWLVLALGWVRQADHDHAVYQCTLGARDHAHVAAWYCRAADGILTAVIFLHSVWYTLQVHCALLAGSST